MPQKVSTKLELHAGARKKRKKNRIKGVKGRFG